MGTGSSTLPRILPLLKQTLAILLLAILLFALLYQPPATHTVDIGGYDAAYVQGFDDPEYRSPASAAPYMQGSDGRVRWSRASSFLLFPQAGLPGRVTLRLRGWPAEQPPRVQVLLNGHELLADLQTSGVWQEQQLIITGGLLKATDVVLELRPARTTAPDAEQRAGVLLDRAIYEVAPGPSGLIIPYPAQVLAGALVVLLVWLVVGRSPRHTLAGALVVGAAFLLLYRLQPPFYPYPLRWLLPHSIAILGALLALRAVPPLLLRRPALLDALALCGVAGWLASVLMAARQHVTLSVPGVEKDFRVFATRTGSIYEVLQADGFYNLGYPLLLWLVRPLTEGNAFLAARLVAALSGALLLLAGYGLTRSLLADQPQQARAGALLALLLLAYSPLVVQYALYIGSDMPFAALAALTLALLVAGTTPAASNRTPALLFLAGSAAGGAFLMRHLGMILLPWGLLHCLLVGWPALPISRHVLRTGALFALGFLLVAAPQLVVNTLQTGQPLYNQQAKNVWLAVYANTDWGRWDEAPNTIPLSEVVLRDPPRFLANWWRNSVGFLGSGAEDTSEFGRALQLRLLSWPVNWLAIAGLVDWLWSASKMRHSSNRPPARLARLSLLLLLLLYVLAVAMAFVLPRFFLPLTPIYAAAAAWLSVQFATRMAGSAAPEHWLSYYLAILLLLLALLAEGFGLGVRSVLEQQPAEEVAAIELTRSVLRPGERVLTRLPPEVPVAKYSALAHRAIAWPPSAGQDEQAILRQARSLGAAYLLWDETRGPPPLPDPPAAEVAGSSRYRLYRLGQQR